MSESESYVGSVPSVLMQRRDVESGKIRDYLVERMANATRPEMENAFSRFEFYHDITG